MPPLLMVRNGSGRFEEAVRGKITENYSAQNPGAPVRRFSRPMAGDPSAGSKRAAGNRAIPDGLSGSRAKRNRRGNGIPITPAA
jgi:hypothetical protein